MNFYEGRMYKLVFFVPSSHAEAVKDAVFAAGGGKIGLYDKCCWQVEGRGQFRPLAGSNPYLGCTGEEEVVSELRIELVCDDVFIQPVIQALKETHPYEEPAFDITALIDINTIEI